MKMLGQISIIEPMDDFWSILYSGNELLTNDMFDSISGPWLDDAIEDLIIFNVQTSVKEKE